MIENQFFSSRQIFGTPNNSIILIDCIFSIISSSQHGGSIYISQNSFYCTIESCFFFESKCSSNDFFGGAGYFIVKSLDISKTCCYSCYSYDNGASFSIWDTSITQCSYFSWIYCSKISENAFQDSFLGWGTVNYLIFSNSSNNFMSNLGSSFSQRSNYNISIYSYSNFCNNSGSDINGNFFVSFPGLQFNRCNIINIKSQFSIIAIQTNYGNCYSLFLSCIFLNNISPYYINRLGSNQGTCIFNRCKFDTNSIPFNNIVTSNTLCFYSNNKIISLNLLNSFLCLNTNLITIISQKNITFLKGIFLSFVIFSF